jgi:hypothetical protein
MSVNSVAVLFEVLPPSLAFIIAHVSSLPPPAFCKRRHRRLARRRQPGGILSFTDGIFLFRTKSSF